MHFEILVDKTYPKCEKILVLGIQSKVLVTSHIAGFF